MIVIPTSALKLHPKRSVLSLPSSSWPDSITRSLKTIVGHDHVLVHPHERALYAYDATLRRSLPDMVVRPFSTEQVSQVMALAYQHQMPVYPRGSATGLSGGSVPLHGGLVIDLTRMNQILEMNTEDLYARVQPGVVVETFFQEVAKSDLFFPPDPSSARAATMGGSLAENAGGPHAFKYGVFRDYTLGLTVVLADGTVIQTGGKTVKNVSGYDLTHLLVGSEGTLGIITEATMKLIPKPEAKRTILAVYDSLDDATKTVSRIISAGMQPAALEFIDDASIRVVESFLHLGLPLDAAALLLIEVDGPETIVMAQAQVIADFCIQHGARDIQLAHNEKEAQLLWKARKSISSAVARIKPSKVAEDATVPRSQIPEMVRRLKAISQKYGVDLVIFGHIGDGNLHPNIMCDERNPEEMERVWQAVAEIFAVTLELGGTLTGEHGVGYMKAPFLEWEHGPSGVRIMETIKDALDPLHILNPGKIFPNRAPAWPIDLIQWRSNRAPS